MDFKIGDKVIVTVFINEVPLDVKEFTIVRVWENYVMSDRGYAYEFHQIRHLTPLEHLL